MLMYHKVNDIPDNPTTVPVGRFDEQLASSVSSATSPSTSTPCSTTTCTARRCPRRRLLITFDDGYRDILENALPVLQKHGHRAVIFVPVAYMEDSTPLPHETHLIERGMRNPTLDWGLMRELDARRRPGRVARDRPPPARRGEPRRGGARDRGLEAEARGAARARRCGRTPTSRARRRTSAPST